MKSSAAAAHLCDSLPPSCLVKSARRLHHPCAMPGPAPGLSSSHRLSSLSGSQVLLVVGVPCVMALHGAVGLLHFSPLGKDTRSLSSLLPFLPLPLWSDCQADLLGFLDAFSSVDNKCILSEKLCFLTNY